MALLNQQGLYVSVGSICEITLYNFEQFKSMGKQAIGKFFLTMMNALLRRSKTVYMRLSKA